MEQRHNKREADVPDRSFLPYPTRTLDPPISIVDRAKEIEKAQESIKTHVSGKLDLIVKQIRNLQDEAKKIMEQAEVDIELHKVKCNFEKKIGMEIHLYQKDTGLKYFSMLSPKEWGTPPHPYLGSYVIRPDQGFERTDNEN